MYKSTQSFFVAVAFTFTIFFVFLSAKQAEKKAVKVAKRLKKPLTKPRTRVKIYRKP